MTNLNKKCLLLTSSIDPNGCIYVSRSSTLDRANDISKCLQKWLINTDFDVILADNSGYDMGFLNNILNEYKDRLEILSWDGNDYDRNLGKGYGELEILKYAISNSEKIKNHTHFIKSTGRYFIKNINSLLSEINLEEYDLVIKHDFLKNITHTFFFCMSVRYFLERIQNEINVVNDQSGFYIEHYFNNLFHSEIGKKIAIDHLEIDGISGTFNCDVQELLK